MTILLIVNDPPYGSEKVYNALRLATKLAEEQAGGEVRLFLMGDAAVSALRGQTTPQGYYNVERMLKAVLVRRGLVKVCGTCAEARGLDKLGLVEGVEISTMNQLAQWVCDSDKVLTF